MLIVVWRIISNAFVFLLGLGLGSHIWQEYIEDSEFGSCHNWVTNALCLISHVGELEWELAPNLEHYRRQITWEWRVFLRLIFSFCRQFHPQITLLPAVQNLQLHQLITPISIQARPKWNLLKHSSLMHMCTHLQFMRLLEPQGSWICVCASGEFNSQPHNQWQAPTVT